MMPVSGEEKDNSHRSTNLPFLSFNLPASCVLNCFPESLQQPVKYNNHFAVEKKPLFLEDMKRLIQLALDDTGLTPRTSLHQSHTFSTFPQAEGLQG